MTLSGDRRWRIDELASGRNALKIESVKKRIAVNTATNLARYSSSILVVFLITPFIIHNVGNDIYGVWVIILSLLSYAAMLEFGLQESLVKLVSGYEAKGDNKKINEVFSFSIWSMSLFSILCFLVFYFVLPNFLDVFIKNQANMQVAEALLMVLSFDVAIILLKFVFNGMIYGFQLYYIKNTLDIVLSVANPLMIFLFIRGGLDFMALAWAKLIVDALALLIYMAIAKWNFRPLRLMIRGLRMETLREIFSIGIKIFSSSTAQRATRNAQPLIIAFYLPVHWNTLYAIPARLVDYGTDMLYVLSQGYMPIFSEYKAKGEDKLIRSLYFRNTRYILAFFSPIAILFLFFGEPFIRIWIGAEYADKGETVLVLLSAAMLVNSLQPLLQRMLIGVGKINIVVNLAILSSLFLFISGVVLTKLFGINGMAGSIFLTAVITQAFWFRYVPGLLKIRISEYFLNCYSRVSICLTAMFALAALLKSYHYPRNYLEITLETGAALVLYAFMVWFLVLRKDEKAFLQEKAAHMLHLAPGGARL